MGATMMKDLDRILRELDELKNTVGEPLDATNRRRVDLLEEGFRALARQRKKKPMALTHVAHHVGTEYVAEHKGV